MSDEKEYVTVYDGDEIIGVVKFNDNLTSGLMQYPHAFNDKGITKLTDGRYVLIYGPCPNSCGMDPARAEIISEEKALTEILKYDEKHLLKKFGLKIDKIILEEVNFEDD